MSRTLKVNGTEVLLFPMNTMNLSQGENGILPPGSSGYKTHEGTMAIDCYGADLGQDPCYAPCTMKCIYKDSYKNGNACFFESVDEVFLANGTKSKVSMLFIHDNDISDIVVNGVINQGNEFFKEGTAGEASGNHVHIEVKMGKIPTNIPHYPYHLNEYNRYMIPDPMHTWDAFCINFTEVGYAFDYNFKSFESFDLENKPDGEYKFGQDYYYVKNHSLVKGWVEFDKGKFKFYRETDGRRVTDDWLGIPTGVGDRLKYYYMDEEGFMLADQWVTKSNGRFYVGADGVMLEKWHKLKKSNTSTQTATYYLNPDPNYPDGYPVISGFEHGQMVKSSWIASGKRWCFVRSGGEMLFSCQTEINGKWYKFDADGYCVEPDGSDTKYPNIPEVEA